VPLQIADEGKIKRTLLSFTKMFFYFHFRGTFIKKNFSNMYYKIPSGLFSMNCS